MIGKKPELAGRGERLLAIVLDSCIVVAIALFVFLFSVAPLFTRAIESVVPGYGVEFYPTPLESAIFMIGVFLIFAVAIVQWTLIGMKGQSIGKILVKIRIVHARTYKIPSAVKSVVLRSWVGGLLSGNALFALVDSLCIFRRDRRTLHDFLADTVVVKA